VFQVTQLKDQLLRTEMEREKQHRDELILSSNRRRQTGSIEEKFEIDLFLFVLKSKEQEYLLQQQMLLTKTNTLNDIVLFKKELEKSERQREQLSDHLEVNFSLFFWNSNVFDVEFVSLSFENVMKKKSSLLKVSLKSKI